MMNRKILIVEDDIDLNETLYDFLSDYFEITNLLDPEIALNKIYENSYDLMILDVKLPKMNGFELAKKIRDFSNIPIIFLTSLDSSKDIENGFLSGGDDYMTKPFSLVELKYRIEAILKRVYNNATTIKIKQFTFDTTSLELYKNDKKIHLKTKELRLLNLFLKQKNTILSKTQIFNEIYDFDETPNELSLRVFISTLRKLGFQIETIKNIGYKFVS